MSAPTDLSPDPNNGSGHAPTGAQVVRLALAAAQTSEYPDAAAALRAALKSEKPGQSDKARTLDEMVHSPVTESLEETVFQGLRPSEQLTRSPQGGGLAGQQLRADRLLDPDVLGVPAT